MRQDMIAEAIRREFELTGDWVSIAGALGVLDIHARAATRLELEAVLRCVDETRDLRLGTVHGGFQEIVSPMPIADLVDEIFSLPSSVGRVGSLPISVDRVGAMMGYFIDVQPLCSQ